MAGRWRRPPYVPSGPPDGVAGAALSVVDGDIAGDVVLGGDVDGGGVVVVGGGCVDGGVDGGVVGGGTARTVVGTGMGAGDDIVAGGIGPNTRTRARRPWGIPATAGCPGDAIIAIPSAGVPLGPGIMAEGGPLGATPCRPTPAGAK